MSKKVLQCRFNRERFEGDQNVHSEGPDTVSKLPDLKKVGGGALPSLAGF